MSVSDNDRRTTINASNGQTSLSGDFILYDQSQVVVTRTRASVDTVLALTTDYTVSGTGVAGGFTVTLLSAAQTGDVYVIEGDRPVTSDAAFSTGGDFKATEVNGRLDRAAVERQELRRDVDDLLDVIGDIDTGDGLITGSLTASTIPLAQDASTLDDSILTQSGSNVIQLTAAAVPAFAWKNTGAGTNEKTWIALTNNTQWTLITYNDAGVSGSQAITVTRSGTTVTNVAATATNIGLTGVTTITGATTITGNTGVTGTLASTGNLSTSAGVIIARSTTLTHATSGAVLLNALDQTGIMANGVPQYDGANVVWSLVGTGSIDTTGAVSGDVLYFNGTDAAWGIITGFSGDDGTAANPTYGFVNEVSPAGMGMYRSAADTLGFATNGVERVTIGNSVVAFATAVSIPYNASGRLGLYDSDSSHQLFIVPGSNLTADRVLTITTGDASRTLTFTADATIGGTHSGTSSGTNTGDQTITLSGDASGSGTAGITVTLATVTVGKGGTGLTSGTSGGVPYYSASNTMASSAALGSTHVVLGGGAGSAPNASSAFLFDGNLVKVSDATNPGYVWTNSGGALNEKTWVASANATQWVLFTYNDAGASGSQAITITRSGTTVSTLNLAATTVSVTGAFTVSGNATLGDATTDSHTINGDITQSADTDRTNIFGRARIDQRATDQAYFSHYDMSSTAQYAIRQNASGYTRINAATGQGVDIRINDANVVSYNATTETLSVAISQSADTNVTNIFGRVRIDSRNTDIAYFSHYDMGASGSEALAQNASGDTALNAASGRSIAFQINATNYGALSSAGNWAFGATSTNTITCTGRFFCRQVTDAGPMTATGGTIGEIVFNTSNSKWYGCTVTHATAATWSAFN